MKISNQIILRIAKMCKDGKDIEYIQKHTGVKSIYGIARNLRKAGANIPLPKKKKDTSINWGKLVEKINKK